jgi:phage-related protein
LDIKSNALDSFNEALSKFESGEQDDIKSFKFSILHLSHCIELVLKMYIQTLDENLVYLKCYKKLTQKAKEANVDLLAAYKLLEESEFDFSTLINGHANPYTITVDHVISIAKNEMCSITGNKFVDQDFIDDINWMKGLRNSIEHYEFEFTVKEVRLCIGRLVRGLDEFTDVFSLFNLESEVGKDKFHVFSVLADEYEQTLSEAHHEVKETEDALYRGTRLKEQMFIEWNVYTCESCGYDTMIPNSDSSTGYKCTYCENEESEEIEVDCDTCYLPWANGEMTYLDENLANVCPRCVNPEAW